MIAEKDFEKMNNRELVKVYFRMICNNFISDLKKEVMSREEEIIEILDKDELGTKKNKSFRKLTDSLFKPIHAELEEKMFKALPGLSNDLRKVATEIYTETMDKVAEELPRQIIEVLDSRRK